MSIAGTQNNPGKKRVKTGIILEGGYKHKATVLSVLGTITACMEAERLINKRATVGLNKLIDLNELLEVLAGNRDIFEIIKRNAKI